MANYTLEIIAGYSRKITSGFVQIDETRKVLSTKYPTGVHSMIGLYYVRNNFEKTQSIAEEYIRELSMPGEDYTVEIKEIVQ